MDVADVEEVLVWAVFGTAVTADYEDVVFGREGYGDGVVQGGGSCIGTPVDGVDGNA